jgi:hypothetical protein
MKRQIRRSVFETNSSSTHSVSISKKKSNYYNNSCLKKYIGFDNKVHVEFGEFGWEIEHYNSPYSKLQYITTMLIETEGRDISTVEELFETDGFKLINEAISNYCNCDGIWIDSRIEMKSYEWDGEVEVYISHDGYIDHQSHEDYNSVQDFLDDYGVDVTKFVFDEGVCVITDNDNH